MESEPKQPVLYLLDKPTRYASAPECIQDAAAANDIGGTLERGEVSRLHGGLYGVVGAMQHALRRFRCRCGHSDRLEIA